MNRTLLQQCLARKTGISLGIGSALWILWLIKGALTLRDHTGSTQYDMQIGPVLLNSLGKHRMHEGGYSITLSFELGMLWCIVACCAVGIAWGFLCFFRQRQAAGRKE